MLVLFPLFLFKYSVNKKRRRSGLLVSALRFCVRALVGDIALCSCTRRFDIVYQPTCVNGYQRKMGTPQKTAAEETKCQPDVLLDSYADFALPYHPVQK